MPESSAMQLVVKNLGHVVTDRPLLRIAAAAAVDGPGVANGFCITPLQIFEWYILEHILMKLAKDNA